jgi:hypothetical protein
MYKFGKENNKLKEHVIYKSFENFDQYIDWRAKNVTKRQKDFFFDSNNMPLMNYVGKLEKIDSEIEQISKKLGIPVVIPRMNQSSNSKRKFEEKVTDLSPYSIEIINDLYHDDFDLFGYDKLK